MKKMVLVLLILMFFILAKGVFAGCTGTYKCARVNNMLGTCDITVWVGGGDCSGGSQYTCAGLASNDCPGHCVYNDGCTWCTPSCPSSYCGSPSNGCGGTCTCNECNTNDTKTYDNGGSCGTYHIYYSCKTTGSGCTECETCSTKCGQAKDCGGTCSNDDNGAPAAPTLVSPIGSAADPVSVVIPVELDWNPVRK